MRSEGLHNWMMIPLEGVKNRTDHRVKVRHVFRAHLVNNVGAWKNQNQVTRESIAGKRRGRHNRSKFQS